MKTALSFFIFITACWIFGPSANAQNPVPAFSFAGAAVEIVAPAIIEMKQTKEFNILELPGLIVKLTQYKKNPGLRSGQNAALLPMNFAEFTLIGFSAHQFAVTIPLNATGLSVVNGKSYISAIESLSINRVKDERTDGQVFKVTGTLSFNDRSNTASKENLSPLIVTVNLN